MMSIVNLSNITSEASPRWFLGGAIYPQAINPEVAVSFGKDVRDLTMLQPDAFFDKPLTEKLASQPLVNERVTQAWLKLARATQSDVLLDQNFEQTEQILKLAEAVDGALKSDTLDTFIALMEPRSVLLPREEFQLITNGANKEAKLFLPDTERVQPTTVYTILSGLGDVVWHDMETGISTKRTDVSAGDIIVVEKGSPSSFMNLSLTAPQIVLVQTRNS